MKNRFEMRRIRGGVAGEQLNLFRPPSEKALKKTYRIKKLVIAKRIEELIKAKL